MTAVTARAGFVSDIGHRRSCGRYGDGSGAVLGNGWEWDGVSIKRVLEVLEVLTPHFWQRL